MQAVLLVLAGLSMVACGDSHNVLTAAPASRRSVAEPGGMVGLGFKGVASGFLTGKVLLTGGGAYDPTTASNAPSDLRVPNLGGGFSCIDGVEQLNLDGCATGEGVRWDTAKLLASSPFKCSEADAPKTATTSAHTVVLKADFYRAGDANDESFTANMIVSDGDLADNIDGVQNFWIQGVGCGTADVHFNGGAGASATAR